MAADRDRRTERPSGRKIEKAKEKGQVARSQDLGQAASLGAFLLWTALSGASFLAGLSAYLVASLRAAGRPPSDGALLDSLLNAGTVAMRLMLPLLFTIAAAGLLSQAIQGLHIRKPLLKVDFANLNPVNGLKHFVSVEKLVAAGKALLRAGFYAALSAAVVLPEWNGVAQLALASPAGILAGTTRIVGRVLVRALVLGLVIAAADFAFARWRWYRNLYMTKQEVRDEHRESEGSPEVRSRIRARQRELARRRMMAAIPTANVVVTNPTHVAVALKYDRAKMAAPVVVAKGKGLIAQRIKEVAREHRVPIVEDPPLARTLEKVCKLGAPIPETLFRAVAEVLAYVMNPKRRALRPHPEVEPAGTAP